MFRKKSVIRMVIIASLSLLLTSCDITQNGSAAMQEDNVSLAEASETVSESKTPEDPDPSSREDVSESSSRPASSAAESKTDKDDINSQNASGGQEEPAFSQRVIAVTPIGAEGEYDTFYITDDTTQDRIAVLLATIMTVEPVQNPLMGGFFFHISITLGGGDTMEFELSNHDNTPNGDYRIYIVGDAQPYSVDPVLWDILAESFPKFAR